MNWNECTKKFIRKVEVDKERIKSIIKKAMQRLQRIRETIIKEENISFIVEDYYEIIKELLISYLLKNGLRSKNHQCLISYFYKERPEYEQEVYLISQMSYFRNRLEYYGENIPREFYEKNRDDFERIITLIKALIGDID